MRSRLAFLWSGRDWSAGGCRFYLRKTVRCCWALPLASGWGASQVCLSSSGCRSGSRHDRLALMPTGDDLNCVFELLRKIQEVNRHAIRHH
jgi:hypothetical protein